MRLCLLKYSLGIVALVFPIFIWAAVMQSNTYRIQSDSINIGGGLSTSTNYRQESTFGEIGTGTSSSATYNLSAGYQALQNNYLAITNSADISLPAIGGVSGGNSTGQSTWTVTTDDPAGYQLTIVATSSPALKSTNSSVPDYVPAGAAPDFTFTYGASASVFGFSPEGTDIVSRYKDNGSACNTGSSDTTDRCWDGLSTTPTTIAESTAPNHPNGTATTIKYQVGIGSSKIQDAGTYNASVVVTATAL